MKRLSIFLFAVFCGSLLMKGCEEDAGGDQNQNQSNGSVVAKADQSPQTEAVATRSTNATATVTVVTDAKISLNVFELEMLNLSVSLDVLSELEIELKQPRIITLVARSEAKSEIIAEGKLENGVYSAAEFSYYKNLKIGRAHV